MILTVNQINTTISGIYGTEKYNIPYSKEIYKQLVDLEDEFSAVNTLEDAKKIIESAKTIIDAAVFTRDEVKYGEYLIRDSRTNEFFLKVNDKVSKRALPQVLVTMLLEALDKEMDILPYVKCWAWFLKNPRYSNKKAAYFAAYLATKYVDQEEVIKFLDEGYDEEQAIKLATHNDISITKNGLISTYKYAQIVNWKFDETTGDKVNRYPVTYNSETGEANVKLPENAEDYVLMPPIMGESGDAYYAGDVLGHRIIVGATHKLPVDASRNTVDGTAGGGGLEICGLFLRN